MGKLSTATGALVVTGLIGTGIWLMSHGDIQGDFKGFNIKFPKLGKSKQAIEQVVPTPTQDTHYQGVEVVYEEPVYEEPVYEEYNDDAYDYERAQRLAEAYTAAGVARFDVNDMYKLIKIVNGEYEATGAHVTNSNVNYVLDFFTGLNSSDPYIVKVNEMDMTNSSTVPKVEFNYSVYDLVVGDRYLKTGPVLEYLDKLHRLVLTGTSREQIEKNCTKFFTALAYLIDGQGVTLDGQKYSISDFTGNEGITALSLVQLYIYDIEPLSNGIDVIRIQDPNGGYKETTISEICSRFKLNGRYYSGWEDSINSQSKSM